MPYWIELHCAAEKEDGTAARSNATGCWSMVNDNPSVMTDDPRGILPTLHQDAQRVGWRRFRGGWACPACQKAGRSPPVAKD